MWQALTKPLPSNIFNFCRKILILCLPNKSSLYRWTINEEIQWFLCHHMQTQPHVLSNCEECLNTYTWRHDSVVNSLLQQFSKILKTSSKISCDSNKSQYYIQKQPPRGVLKKKGVLKICSKYTGEHLCRGVISIKLLRNFRKRLETDQISWSDCLYFSRHLAICALKFFVSQLVTS